MYAKSQSPQALALFDFDGTLCKKDSFTGFMFYAHSHLHIIKQGLMISPWILAYYAKSYPAHLMRPKLYQALFKNTSADQINHLAHDYAQNLLRFLDPELLHQLHSHQRRGDHIVVVSASLDLYLQPLCQHLGIELLCSEVEIKNDRLTGFYASKDCSNEQKVIRILEKYDLSHYSHVYAYGNSEEDLAMLELADTAHYVGRDYLAAM